MVKLAVCRRLSDWEEHFFRQRITFSQTTDFVNPLAAMRQNFGCISLSQIKWFDHSLSLAIHQIYKREIYREILGTNFSFLIFDADLCTIKQLSDITFKQSFLIFFGNKITFDIVIKQLYQFGFWVIRKYNSLL